MSSLDEPAVSVASEAEVAIDARAPAATERLLGLPHWQRLALAARHAGCSELQLWVADPGAVARFQGWVAQDARLSRIRVSADEPPAATLRLPGAAVLDAPAIQALRAGAAWPPGEGLCLAAELPAAEKVRALLSSLANSSSDGLVDTWLNRPISRQLTRLLVGTGISPNAVTVLSCLIGIAGAAAIASCDPRLGVVGAHLFQLSAAVDCVDGEIARLTYRFSPFGARLDLALDNLVHLLIFPAVALAASTRLGPELAWVLGGATCLGAFVSFLIVYWLTFSGSAGTSSGLRRLLDKLTNRDFSLAVIAAAILGRWDLLLWVLAAGTNLFWLVLGSLALWGRRGR